MKLPQIEEESVASRLEKIAKEKIMMGKILNECIAQQGKEGALPAEHILNGFAQSLGLRYNGMAMLRIAERLHKKESQIMQKFDEDAQ